MNGLHRKAGLLILLLCGACSPSAVPTSQPTTPPTTAQAVPTAAYTPSPVLDTPIVPTPAAPTVTSTPTDPLFPYTIAGLRARTPQTEGAISRTLIADQGTFTSYAIRYPSDGLIVTGTMMIPDGEGPFPVVILNHGYFDPGFYQPGTGTADSASYLSRVGYLTIAPDFRGWAGSDVGPSLFHTGLVRDVLNLIDLLPTIPEADPARLGMWGHSMGGGITTKVLVVDERVRAAVLYAPNSAYDGDLIARWGPGCLPGQSEAAGDRCNAADFVLPELPAEVVDAYLAAAADPVRLQEVAPIYHLDAVTAPVAIHIGDADGAGNAETPPDWSTTLHEALIDAGKDSTLYTYPGQGHFFQGQDWVTFMTRAAAFFEAHLTGP